MKAAKTVLPAPGIPWIQRSLRDLGSESQLAHSGDLRSHALVCGSCFATAALWSGDGFVHWSHLTISWRWASTYHPERQTRTLTHVGNTTPTRYGIFQFLDSYFDVPDVMPRVRTVSTSVSFLPSLSKEKSRRVHIMSPVIAKSNVDLWWEISASSFLALDSFSGQASCANVILRFPAE